MYAFAVAVNSGYVAINGKLTADITVNKNVISADGSLNGIPSRKWTPIGHYVSDNDNILFAGTFEGNGKTISGLYITDANKGCAGFFGCVGRNGIISNVHIADSWYDVSFDGNLYLGGIVGDLFRATVTGSTFSGVISGSGTQETYVGCIMGGCVVHCSAEEAAVKYMEYFANEKGFPLSARQDLHSSDSTPFADKGVPAISFARYAPPSTGTIHNSYDTKALMSGEQMAKDIDFIVAFTDRMANSVRCPVSREIPDNIKDKLDIYLTRKRGPKR